MFSLDLPRWTDLRSELYSFPLNWFPLGWAPPAGTRSFPCCRLRGQASLFTSFLPMVTVTLGSTHLMDGFLWGDFCSPSYLEFMGCGNRATSRHWKTQCGRSLSNPRTDSQPGRGWGVLVSHAETSASHLHLDSGLRRELDGFQRMVSWGCWGPGHRGDRMHRAATHTDNTFKHGLPSPTRNTYCMLIWI